MDVSGSMTKQKKYLARSFFFLLYQFIRYRYNSIDLVFISHTTEAKEVSEDDFFKKTSNGGTYISSGIVKALDVINSRYSPTIWNIYGFHCSDGENWAEDNNKAIAAMKNLIELSQLSGYIQIKDKKEATWGDEMAKIFNHLVCDSFKIVHMHNKKDIWPQFAKLFGGKYDI